MCVSVGEGFSHAHSPTFQCCRGEFLLPPLFSGGQQTVSLLSSDLSRPQRLPSGGCGWFPVWAGLAACRKEWLPENAEVEARGLLRPTLSSANPTDAFCPLLLPTW